MADQLGWRKVFAVVGPSTNTTVQPEYEALRPPGVTLHYRAFLTEDPPQVDDASFSAGVAAMSTSLQGAFAQARSLKPDAVVLGISVLSFIGGVAWAQQLQAQLQVMAGVPVTLGSLALHAALQALGGVRRVALLTPYWPSANRIVGQFLQDAGYELRRDVALRAPSWTGIARFTRQQVLDALQALDGDDVDALVQVGTNLPMLSLLEDAEARHGKPVVAVNMATWWQALRDAGIQERRSGAGCLWARH